MHADKKLLRRTVAFSFSGFELKAKEDTSISFSFLSFSGDL